MTLLLKPEGEMSRRAENLQFCQEFCRDGTGPKFIFGRNVYGRKLVEQVRVDGFVDDFTADTSFLGLPIIPTAQIPTDALVLIASGGRPMTVKAKLDQLGIRCLDYFAFHRLSGLALTDVVFNEGFQAEFEANAYSFHWVYNLLADETSRTTFQKLLSFRYSYDLSVMDGFEDREDRQYFENFLDLAPQGEHFVDVGGYDGATSLEFSKRCPAYRAIDIFEPEAENFNACARTLGGLPNVRLHRMGLSDRRQDVPFRSGGSGSRLSADGNCSIAVDRLDTLVIDPVSFIKMDIEGAELKALAGAAATIRRFRPRLAIAVYHHPSDLWRIPKLILAMANGYEVYLRHYTESIYETVMYFTSQPTRGNRFQVTNR